MLSCPRCAHSLFSGQAGRVAMHACGGCGGLWLDRASAAQVDRSLSQDALDLARQAASHGRQPIDAQRAAPCAVCRRPMRRFVAPATSLELDECPDHGTWYDRGELEMVARAVHRRAPAGGAPGQAPPGYAASAPVPGSSGHVAPGAFPPPSGGGLRAGHVALGVGAAAAVGVGAAAMASSQGQAQQLQQQVAAQSSGWGDAASDAVEVLADGMDAVDVVEVAGAAVRGAEIAGHAAASAVEALADGELLASGAEAASSVVGGIFSLIGSLFD